MSATKCKNCRAPFVFTDVLKSVSPVSVRCSRCKAYTRVKRLPVALLVVLASLVSVAAVVALMTYQWLLLAVLIAIGVAGEYIYYRLLRAGYLTDTNNPNA